VCTSGTLEDTSEQVYFLKARRCNSPERHTIGFIYAYRSVVKIKNVCTGTAGTDYSDGPTVVLPWDVNAASSPDNCVVQYTTLTDHALTINALAIDGSDNLWVRFVSHMNIE
jgi:hypothetical protein